MSYSLLLRRQVATSVVFTVEINVLRYTESKLMMVIFIGVHIQKKQAVVVVRPGPHDIHLNTHTYDIN